VSLLLVSWHDVPYGIVTASLAVVCSEFYYFLQI
jgi:hypothetical protein